MDSPIQQGYLVLADLSGYTSFLAENELDHSQAILQGVLTLLINHLTPTMTLAEVEGDAVFVYAPASRLDRGELLLELVEETYAAFRNRQRTMVHNATCPCRACQSVANLDLKFVAHYGPFVLQDVTGRAKPVGSCVNLAHRLLKNGVGEATGWNGYALFSEACLEQMGLAPEEGHRGREAYEHLGEVGTCTFDLDASYRASMETRHVELAEEDADVVVRAELPVPPPVAWDWLSDVHKRAQWMKGADWQPADRPGGRTGAQAKNHCAASGFIEHVLDWRPFDYYTVRYTRGSLHFLISARLTPSETGTHVRWLMKGEAGFPRWVRRPATRLLANRLMKVGESFEALVRLTA
jgi:hypothetical protein